MFALLPSSIIAPGYSGTPTFGTSSPGWANQEEQRSGGGEGHQVRRMVTIYRDSLDTPWGFRLQGGKDFSAPLTVKRVFSGSPADGQLTRDDLILTINDQSADDMTHLEALEKVKSAGSSIVLTIQTSADSDFETSFPTTATAQLQQAPQQETRPTSIVHNVDYELYQPSPPDKNYATSSDEQDRPSANVCYPKVTTQSRHRSARRFQANSAVPSGLSEPGWVPRPKSLPRSFLSSSPQPSPPPSQHRSAVQAARQPVQQEQWRSQYTTDEEPSVPAWYGSLRSTRSAHPWEVRAAKVPTSQEEEPPTNAWKEFEQVQSQQPRTYKTEIRGLVLSRPSYNQTQSVPEDVSVGRVYCSNGQAHSAPETPIAEAMPGYVYSAVESVPSYQDNQSSATINLQQSEGATPVKIQPSVLFGASSYNTPIQAQTQAHVTLRAQTRESNTRATRVQQREVTVASSQVVPAPQVVSTPQVVSVPKEMPAAQVRNSASASNPAQNPAAPQKQPTQQPSQPKQPDTAGKQLQQPPTTVQFRSAGNQATLIERFNPTPDRPGESTTKTPSMPLKYPQTPVEHFNPTPDRPGESTKKKKVPTATLR